MSKYIAISRAVLLLDLVVQNFGCSMRAYVCL